MTIQTFGTKQPFEAYYVSFSFALALNDATISSASVSATDAEGKDVTGEIIGAVVISGCRVNVWVKGGTEQTYKITCKITTSLGEQFEEDGYLPVEEK